MTVAEAGVPRSRSQLDRSAMVAVACFWACFVLVYTIRKALTYPTEALELLVPRMAIALVGAALSWAMHRALERQQARSLRTQVAWIIALAPPVALAFAASDTAIAAWVTPDLSSLCGERRTCGIFDVWVVELNNAVGWLFTFVAWGLLCLSLRATAEANAAAAQAQAGREAARVAEIRALRYQLDPHFLFNCLNSLGTLIERRDTSAARTMVGEMGEFLRYGLAIDPLADVQLEDEIEMQSRYLDIERRRFSHRLAVEIAVAPEVRNARIPSLLLQPLVENAVKHGVASTSAPVRVSLAATATSDGRVAVWIEDDAPVVRSKGDGRGGIGLRNVAERLEARFDGAAELNAGPLPKGGYRASIVMPLIMG